MLQLVHKHLLSAPSSSAHFAAPMLAFHGLLPSGQTCSRMGPSHGLQLPSGHTLLQCGVIHSCSVDICSSMVSPGAAGDASITSPPCRPLTSGLAGLFLTLFPTLLGSVFPFLT